MSISLVKGQKISLTKENKGLKKIMIGLGWDAAKGLFSPKIDCDSSAIALDTNNQYKGLVYYGNLREFGIIHHGDNLTGEGNGDDEQITIDLEKLDQEVGTVVFAVNIYDCESRRQDFGKVKNAYIRLENEETGEEICRYNLTDSYAGKTAVIFGEVYKHNGEWKFNAIGNGTNHTSISQLRDMYR